MVIVCFYFDFEKALSMSWQPSTLVSDYVPQFPSLYHKNLVGVFSNTQENYQTVKCINFCWYSYLIFPCFMHQPQWEALDHSSLASPLGNVFFQWPFSWSSYIKPPILFSAYFILMHSDMKQASAILNILAVPASPNWQSYRLGPLNFGCPGRPPFGMPSYRLPRLILAHSRETTFLVTLAQIQPLTCFHHSWLLCGTGRQTDRNLRLGIEVEVFLCPAVTFWRGCLS